MTETAILNSFCVPTLHLAEFYDLLDDPSAAWSLVGFDAPPTTSTPPSDKPQEVNRLLENGLFIQAHRLAGPDLFWWAHLVSVLRERAGIADSGVFPGSRLKGVEFLLHLILDVRPPPKTFHHYMASYGKKQNLTPDETAARSFIQAALRDQIHPFEQYISVVANRVGDIGAIRKNPTSVAFPTESPGKRIPRLALVAEVLTDEKVDVDTEVARELADEFHRLLPLVRQNIKKDSLELTVACTSLHLRLGEPDEALALLGNELVKDAELMLALVQFAKLGAERAIQRKDINLAEKLYSLAKNGMARFTSPEAQTATKYFEAQIKKIQQKR